MSLCFLLFSQANQVLQSFLQSQAEVEAGILQADEALKDADKAVSRVPSGWVVVLGEAGLGSSMLLAAHFFP